MLQVLLLNMPFSSLTRPAIGISLLKARLSEEGINCTVGYGNHLFAEWTGLPTYSLLNDRLACWMFAGDWIFSTHLFPKLDRSPYIKRLASHLGNGAEFAAIMALRAQVMPFLTECITRFDVPAYDVVGFTTTFEQNLASLSLAALIKERFPEKIIVFGGANCEGVMGLELHRSFPFIDFVCSGESDDSFPELLKRIRAGTSDAGIPGVVTRHNNHSVPAAPPDRVQDLDRLPDPDYSDFILALQRSPFRASLKPLLLIESARGCWWGDKSHCTFCGLNGLGLAFRRKSGERVYHELERQKLRCGIDNFEAVDNIMSLDYFRDLLPMLKDRSLGISLFYEVKANLKREQIEMMRDAGITSIQPGIEHLNSNVLRLMKKGITGIQNIQLMRLCREYGIRIFWNFLYGFPGETAADYIAVADVVDSLQHLTPPGKVARFRLDRYSPMFERAEEFGLTDVQPYKVYGDLYDLPASSIANLAYYFDFRYEDGRDAYWCVAPALARIREWKLKSDGDLIKVYTDTGEMTIIDTRLGRQPRSFPMTGFRRKLYEFCDEIQSRAKIERLAAEQSCCEILDQILDEFKQDRLIVNEGQQYLSLAVDTRRISTIDVGIANSVASMSD